MALPSAYPKLGKFLFPSDWRPSLVGDEFTDVAWPPEISGGTGGFADLKEILVGPPGQAREEMRAWAGEDYAPERFDLDAANAAVAAI